MRTKFLTANEAFNCILHELRTEGLDFDNTKALVLSKVKIKNHKCKLIVT